MERRSHVIQSDVLIWLMWAEDWTHNRCVELTSREYVDPHNYMSSHHGGIQHRVKVPMPYGKLNIDHHAAQQHPLKMTWKHGSKKYKISQ